MINGGQAAFKVARLDLGRGLAGENAAFTLALTDEGFVLRDLDAGSPAGRCTGGSVDLAAGVARVHRRRGRRDATCRCGSSPPRALSTRSSPAS